jgi:hypothetical protein
MTNRKSGFWKNLTIMILGGAGLSTWMTGACDSVDGNQDINVKRSALQSARDSLEAVKQIPAGYGVTPGGIVMHEDCVHQIPDGAVAYPDLSVTMNGKKIAQYAECKHKKYRLAGAADGATPGTGNGWVESSWGWANSTMFNHLETGYWVVPANPVNHGQTIFLFPSLENNTSIIQPVLQWGHSAAGGGASWTYANWWVTGTTTMFVSTLKNTSPGHQFWGSLDMTNQIGVNQYWNIQIKDVTSGVTTNSNVVVNQTDPFNAAQVGVLEAYGVSTCDSFPSGSSGQTYFPNPIVTQGVAYYDRNFITPSWFGLDYVSMGWTGPNCSLSVSVGSTGNTWLNY